MSSELDRWEPPAPPATPEFAAGWEASYLSAFPRTIQERASTDRRFRAELLAARHVLVDILRHEAVRRAVEPVQRPIIQRGEVVAYEEQRDNKHLEWMLERLDPDEWNLARKLEVSGRDGEPIRFSFQFGAAPEEIQAEDGDFSEE